MVDCRGQPRRPLGHLHRLDHLAKGVGASAAGEVPEIEGEQGGGGGCGEGHPDEGSLGHEEEGECGGDASRGGAGGEGQSEQKLRQAEVEGVVAVAEVEGGEGGADEAPQLKGRGLGG